MSPQTFNRIVLMHQLFDEKPEAEKREFMALKKKYPEAFKYLIIIPFAVLKSTDKSDLRRSLNNRIKYFLDIYEFLRQRDKLDLFDDFGEFVYAEYGCGFVNVNRRCIVERFERLL